MSLCAVRLSQIDDWDFDIFDLSIKTSGRPLYTVCMALMEKEGLLVPALPALPCPGSHTMFQLLHCYRAIYIQVACRKQPAVLESFMLREHGLLAFSHFRLGGDANVGGERDTLCSQYCSCQEHQYCLQLACVTVQAAFVQ